MDNSTLYIVIAAVAIAVLLLILFVVLGLKRKKARTVSFTPKEEPKELTQQQKSGNYQAQSGFNFAPAQGQVKQPVTKPVKQEHKQDLKQDLPPTPVAKQPASVQLEEQNPVEHEPIDQKQSEQKPTEQNLAEQPPLDSEPASTQTVEPQGSAVQEQRPEDSSVAHISEEELLQTPAPRSESPVQAAERGETPAIVVPEPDTEAAPTSQISEEAALEEAAACACASHAKAAEEETVAEPAMVEQIDDSEVPVIEEDSREETEEDSPEPADTFEELEDFGETSDHEDEEAPTAEEPSSEEVAAVEAAVAAQQVEEAAEQALQETPVPEQTPQPQPAVEVEEIDPASGRIGRLRGRLSRSQNVFGQSVLGMLSAGDLDDDAWEEIEDELIQADLGAGTTMEVVDQLRERIAREGVASEEQARSMLREVLIQACHPEMDRSIKAMPFEGKPAVILVVGVNGTGKTTTTGKLARVLVSMGHSVVLGAADTFRAAAADQLETWGRRVGARTIRGKEGADPAAVAFDAVAEGVASGADVVLIDTAGRLHNSANLMDQLGKVKRVVEKKTDVDEVLLVLDATTGQNGMEQAKVFSQVVDITGVVLTKLDGTAKGGIVFRVQNELGVPVKLVGLGEGADHLAPFEVEGFIDALLGTNLN